MKIPRKIDDRLRDAIVSVQFEPGVAANAVEGYFDVLFKDTFEAISLGQPNRIQIDQLVIQPQQTFYIQREKKFRVDITSNSITFNLINEYLGWKEYSTVLKETLTLLLKEKVIAKVNRIGIRYISVFDQLRIFDKIKPNLRFLPFDENSSRAQFRIELDRDPFLVIVTIINAFPKPEGEIYSVIDIDTIKIFDLPEVSSQEILKCLEAGHSEQKEVFFSLLEQEFIQSLHPEY